MARERDENEEGETQQYKSWSGPMLAADEWVHDGFEIDLDLTLPKRGNVMLQKHLFMRDARHQSTSDDFPASTFDFLALFLFNNIEFPSLVATLILA